MGALDRAARRRDARREPSPRSTLMDVVVVVGAGAIGLLTLLAARLRGAGSIVVTDRSAHRLAVARDARRRPGDRRRRGRSRSRSSGRDGRPRRGCRVRGGRDRRDGRRSRCAVARSGGHVTWIGNSAPTVELPMQELVTRELTLRGAYTFDEEFEQAADAIAAGADRRSPAHRARPRRSTRAPDLFRAARRPASSTRSRSSWLPNAMTVRFGILGPGQGRAAARRRAGPDPWRPPGRRRRPERGAHARARRGPRRARGPGASRRCWRGRRRCA